MGVSGCKYTQNCISVFFKKIISRQFLELLLHDMFVNTQKAVFADTKICIVLKEWLLKNCLSFTYDSNLINEYNTYDNYYAIVDHFITSTLTL